MLDQTLDQGAPFALAVQAVGCADHSQLADGADEKLRQNGLKHRPIILLLLVLITIDRA